MGCVVRSVSYDSRIVRPTPRRPAVRIEPCWGLLAAHRGLPMGTGPRTRTALRVVARPYGGLPIVPAGCFGALPLGGLKPDKVLVGGRRGRHSAAPGVCRGAFPTRTGLRGVSRWTYFARIHVQTRIPVDTPETLFSQISVTFKVKSNFS